MSKKRLTEQDRIKQDLCEAGITDKGMSLCEDLYRSIVEALRRGEASLSDEDLRYLGNLVERVGRAATHGEFARRSPRMLKVLGRVR